MDQLDSRFYKPVALNKRPTANLCPLSTTVRIERTFAFQFDRNMARQFHSETASSMQLVCPPSSKRKHLADSCAAMLVAARELQRGNMFL
jgi:hypothetical protein